MMGAPKWPVIETGGLEMAPALPPSAVNPSRKSTRKAYFPEAGGYVETPVYDRYALAPGMRIAGPAVVEERESSCSFGPDCSFTVDRFFNLVVDIDHGQRAAAQAKLADARFAQEFQLLIPRTRTCST